MSVQDEFIGAVFIGNVSHARELLKAGARIGDDEILHSAAQSGNVEMLELLLKSGGLEFIDQFDSLSFTPLTYAARKGDMAAVKLLLKAGADVNAVDTRKIGNSTLREIVGDGNVEIIKVLLEAGADPHLPGWMQMSAVDKAKTQWNNESPIGRKVLNLLTQNRWKLIKFFPTQRLANPENDSVFGGLYFLQQNSVNSVITSPAISFKISLISLIW